MLNIVCRHPIKMSLVCLLDGVTGRQPTVVAAVAVPQSDEVRKGVGLGLLQATPREDPHPTPSGGGPAPTPDRRETPNTPANPPGSVISSVTSRWMVNPSEP